MLSGIFHQGFSESGEHFFFFTDSRKYFIYQLLATIIEFFGY